MPARTINVPAAQAQAAIDRLFRQQAKKAKAELRKTRPRDRRRG